MHFEGDDSVFSCSFEAPIASAFACCSAVASADLSLRYISSRPLSSPFAILCLRFFFGHLFTRPNDPLWTVSSLHSFFRGMPVAAHCKFTFGWILSTQKAKTANLIDSWSYILRSRDSAILASTLISKHNSCDSGREHSAIPPFHHSGKESKYTEVRHFRRHFDIVYWIEHHPFRVTHRVNEFTVPSASQVNQRVQQPNLRVYPAYVPSA